MKILYVEDNENDFLMVQEMLTHVSDSSIHPVQITRARNLNEAFQVLSDEDMDMTLLDLGLSESQGAETFDRFVEKGRDIPVVIITGQADDQLSAMIMQKGAQDYISKDDVNRRNLIKSIFYANLRAQMKRELVRSNEKLRQLDDLKDNLLNNVSHELRTPLTIIRECISQVNDGLFGDVNEKQNHYLDKSLANIDRLRKIIDDLLDVSKIEKGKLELMKSQVNIVTLIEEVVADFSVLAQKKGLQIKTSVPAEGALVLADKEKIIQVLNNLVGNAIKFTDHGYIEIAMNEDDMNVMCHVKDTGIGIASNDIPRLFSKFEQIGKQGGPQGKGTGLGLVISKGIVEAHGGQIKVKSTQGEGTSISFLLPKGAVKEGYLNDLLNSIRENAYKCTCFSVLAFGVKNRNDGSDAVIHRLETVIKNNLFRQSDQTIRDHDFVFVILPYTEKAGAMAVADRIHRLISTEESLPAILINQVYFPDDGLGADELISKLRTGQEVISDEKNSHRG